MDCKYIENKVWLYVEGDLDHRKHEAATQHIRCCQQCAGLVEEARSSQEWLRSCKPGRFDEAFMDSVRRGARQRIAEQKSSRLEFAAMFSRVNWKPLIIACPVLLLICWVGFHRVIRTRSNSPNSTPVAVNDGSAPKHVGNKPDRLTENIVLVKDRSIKHHKRIPKRVEPAPGVSVGARGEILASVETYQPPMRIEIQTADPNVRIIWFASPGDGPVPFGPEK